MFESTFWTFSTKWGPKVSFGGEAKMSAVVLVDIASIQ